MLLCRVWLTTLIHARDGNHWKISMSIWTMHVLTIHVSPLIVFSPPKLGGWRNQLRVQAWLRVTPSFLDIWNKNFKRSRSQTGRGWRVRSFGFSTESVQMCLFQCLKIGWRGLNGLSRTVESTLAIKQKRREIGLCLIEKKLLYEVFDRL
jgi:hypothetical protein